MRRIYTLSLFVFLHLFMSLPAFSQIPSLKLKDISGKTVDVSTIASEGKPVIFSFFATWCKPCINELNAIHDVYEEWQKETGVQLVVVSIDKAQDIAKVKPLVDGNEWEYLVLLDVNEDFKRAMKVNGVPHVFIVNPQGKIVYNHLGYAPGSEKELLEEVRKLK